jgi:DNA-binding transcriptional regulator YdaS (Cro superfamily)
VSRDFALGLDFCQNLTLYAKMNTSQALKLAIERAGGVYALGRALGITGQAVGQWMRAPVMQVFRIEKLTGVSRHDLRPDIWPRDRSAK